MPSGRKVAIFFVAQLVCPPSPPPRLCSAVLGLLASLPVLTGPVRQWLDRLPLYNLYAAFSSTSFLVALAAMLRGNVSVREALERLRGSASAYVQWHINRMGGEPRHLRPSLWRPQSIPE